jgi:TonB family protein
MSGEFEILPDPPDLATMRRTGRGAIVLAKICVTPEGAVASVKLLKPTGYPAYERKVVEKVKAWRYRPGTGEAAEGPVCAPLTWIYSPT